MPGGQRYSVDGGFYAAGSGHWWSATEYGGGYAYDLYMGSDYELALEHDYDVRNGFSVRCAQ